VGVNIGQKKSFENIPLLILGYSAPLQKLFAMLLRCSQSTTNALPIL
jgi:hypothetical protein